MQKMLKVLLVQTMESTQSPEVKAKLQNQLQRIEKLEAAGKHIEFTQSDVAVLISGQKDLIGIIEDKISQAEATEKPSVNPIEEFIKQLTGGNPSLKTFTEKVNPSSSQQNPLDVIGGLISTVLEKVVEVSKEAEKAAQTETQEEVKSEKVDESSLNKQEDIDLMDENVVVDGSNGINEDEETPDTVEESVVDEPKVYTGKVGVKKKDTQSGWEATFVNKQGVLESGLIVAKWVDRVDVLLPNGHGEFKKKKVGYDRLVSVTKTSFSNPKPTESGWKIYNTGVLSLFDSKVPVLFLGEQKGYERVLVLNSTGEKYPMSKEEVRKYLA